MKLSTLHRERTIGRYWKVSISYVKSGFLRGLIPFLIYVFRMRLNVAVYLRIPSMHARSCMIIVCC
jgi:hypothetical protein